MAGLRTRAGSVEDPKSHARSGDARRHATDRTLGYTSPFGRSNGHATQSPGAATRCESPSADRLCRGLCGSHRTGTWTSSMKEVEHGSCPLSPLRRERRYLWALSSPGVMLTCPQIDGGTLPANRSGIATQYRQIVAPTAPRLRAPWHGPSAAILSEKRLGPGRPQRGQNRNSLNPTPQRPETALGFSTPELSRMIAGC